MPVLAMPKATLWQPASSDASHAAVSAAKGNVRGMEILSRGGMGKRLHASGYDNHYDYDLTSFDGCSAARRD